MIPNNEITSGVILSHSSWKLALRCAQHRVNVRIFISKYSKHTLSGTSQDLRQSSLVPIISVSTYMFCNMYIMCFCIFFFKTLPQEDIILNSYYIFWINALFTEMELMFAKITHIILYTYKFQLLKFLLMKLWIVFILWFRAHSTHFLQINKYIHK